MIVAELIEWLKDQDQGATVTVVAHSLGTDYYGPSGSEHYTVEGKVEEVEFDPGEHFQYRDLRGNKSITPDMPYYNRRYLLLGVDED